MKTEKQMCSFCSGRGYRSRVVVIGTIVTTVNDPCAVCGCKGYIEKSK